MVDHFNKEKNLESKWLQHNVTTAFSAQTYIKNTIETLQTMLNIQKLADYKTSMSEVLHPGLEN